MKNTIKLGYTISGIQNVGNGFTHLSIHVMGLEKCDFADQAKRYEYAVPKLVDCLKRYDCSFGYYSGIDQEVTITWQSDSDKQKTDWYGPKIEGMALNRVAEGILHKIMAKVESGYNTSPLDLLDILKSLKIQAVRYDSDLSCYMPHTYDLVERCIMPELTTTECEG